MENFVKAFLFSSLHASVSAMAGSIIDPFFATRPDETIAETVLWSGLHTSANGLAFSLISKAVFPSDTITLSDPTGGAFLAFPFFIVQPNYINRVRKLGSGLQNMVTGVLRNSMKKEFVANQPETPVANDAPRKYAGFGK